MPKFTLAQLVVLKDKCNNLKFSEFRCWYGDDPDLGYLQGKFQLFSRSPIDWLSYADSNRCQCFLTYLNKPE